MSIKVLRGVMTAALLVACGTATTGCGPGGDGVVLVPPVPLMVTAIYPGGGAVVDPCLEHDQKVDFVLAAFTTDPMETGASGLPTALELSEVSCEGFSTPVGDPLGVTYENYDSALKVASWSIDGALAEGACYRIVVAGTLITSDSAGTLGADHTEYFSTLSACE